MPPPKPPTPEQLALCGEALHGADWHRALARDLGRYHAMSARPSLDYRVIRKWMVADRPIPSWVADVLPRLLAAACAQQPDKAASLEALARQLGYPNLKSIALRNGV